MGGAISKLVDKETYNDLKEYDREEKERRKSQKLGISYRDSPGLSRAKVNNNEKPTAPPPPQVSEPVSVVTKLSVTETEDPASLPPVTPASAPRESLLFSDATARTIHFSEEIFSNVLQDSVRIMTEKEAQIYGNNSDYNVLWFRSSEMPTNETEIPEAMEIMFNWRVKKFSSTMKVGFILDPISTEKVFLFCLTCHSRCESYIGKLKSSTEPFDPLLPAELRRLQLLSAYLILSKICIEYREYVRLEKELQSLISSTAGLDKYRYFLLDRLCGDFIQTEDSLTPSFFADLLTQADGSDEHQAAVLSLMDISGKNLRKLKFHDMMHIKKYKFLEAFNLFFDHPIGIRLIADRLAQEVDDSANNFGSYFETCSIIGPLLHQSCLPQDMEELDDPAHPANQLWVDSSKKATEEAKKSLEEVREILFKLFHGLYADHPMVLVSWLSALLNQNEIRIGTAIEPLPKTPFSTVGKCSDGFMINLCAVLWELCQEFNTTKTSVLGEIDAEYCNSNSCQINYHLESCMANGQIVKEGGDKEAVKVYPKVSKKTHLFHLTMRTIDIGFFPAKKQYEEQKRKLALMLSLCDESTLGMLIVKVKYQKLFGTVINRWQAVLIDEKFLINGTQFMSTASRWLTLWMEFRLKEENDEAATKKRQRKVFTSIPEFYVTDTGQWFSHILNTIDFKVDEVIANYRQHMNMYLKFSCRVLSRHDLTPRPMAAYKTLSALFDMIILIQASGGEVLMRRLEIDFTSNADLYISMAPGLLRLYAGVGVIEGLDVNKEPFDKYRARGRIGQLLKALWKITRSLNSMTRYTGTDVFRTFLSAVFDTLLYQVHDSWTRMANVKEIEDTQDNETLWDSLTTDEKQNKIEFLVTETEAAACFMSQALSTLDLLHLVTKIKDVALDLATPPLSQRTASSFVGFFDKLCGPGAGAINVKNKERFNFDPKSILKCLLEILFLVMRVAEVHNTDFVSCFILDDDYNEAVMETILILIREKGIGTLGMESDMSHFIKLLKEATRGHQKMSGINRCVSRSMSWYNETEAIELDEDDLKEEYEEEMVELNIGDADILDYHSFYNNASAGSININSAKIQAILKEMKAWPSDLPKHPSAAIFIKTDSERMDVIRAVITGPVDTPYSRGCFVFDVYCPVNYPASPPMVKLCTTGNGTVRFNPNLYADGKVCLSLIGTWHGGNSSQMWQPNKSTLYQVLVSIQSLILISEPMFNEPGYDNLRETQEGAARSKKYNSTIRLWTLRHAMFGNLLNPPIGLEEVIRRHFAIQKEAIMKQCAVWLQECEDKDEERRLWRAVDDLRKELDKLETTDSE